MIGFCEKASSNSQSDWLIGSGFSIVVDLVLFELAPALVVSAIGVVSFSCRCRCGFYFLCLVEGYRAIRSLVGL